MQHSPRSASLFLRCGIAVALVFTSLLTVETPRAFEASNDAPIIRMLNALLTQAAKDGASDIHIEPYERSSSVRFRVDGTLREVVQPNRALHAALISRLKIMAELDIAERRLPQDGRIRLRVQGKEIDLRISILPTSHGEKIVIRLLDKGALSGSADQLGGVVSQIIASRILVETLEDMVQSLGPERVHGFLLPYKTSSADSRADARQVDPYERAIDAVPP